MSEDAAVARMAGLEGWFSDNEARVLYRSAVESLTRFPHGALVEIGSYHGRSTVVLASAARDVRPDARVHAIDPHEGILSGIRTGSTWDSFLKNISTTGLSDVVVPIRQSAAEVDWSGPIALLFIDGLHEFENVSADYARFSKFVQAGGCVVFHDYSNPDYPAVRSVVDGLVSSGELCFLRRPSGDDPHDTLVVLRKRAKLSIIIPTCGRESLLATLESAAATGARRTDDLIVVGDGPQPRSRTICEAFRKILPIRYFEFGPTRMSGASQRTFAMGHAVGSHLLFIDDDDTYTPGAIDVIRGAAEDHPERVLVFKEESRTPRHQWGVVWKEKRIELGNVGTQGVVVPNIPGRLGTWPQNNCSDYYFARSTVDLTPGKDDAVVWVDHIVALLH